MFDRLLFIELKIISRNENAIHKPNQFEYNKKYMLA